jgi:hypothetical protein
VDLTTEAIIEEIIDPLIMGDLAQAYPSIKLRRVAQNAIEIDFGQPEDVYVITVESRTRGSRTEGEHTSLVDLLSAGAKSALHHLSQTRGCPPCSVGQPRLAKLRRSGCSVDRSPCDDGRY